MASEGHGSAAVLAYPRLCGIRGDSMPGGGFSRSDDTECCSKAQAKLQNVILCINKVLQVLQLLHNPTGRREDDAHTGPSVPSYRAPLPATPGRCPPACTSR